MEKVIINIPAGTDLNSIINDFKSNDQKKLLTEANLKFDDLVYESLPEPLNCLKELVNNSQKRDMVLLTNLTVLSSLTTNYLVYHGDDKEGPQLYTYVIGNAGKGKGFTKQWKQIAMKYHKYLTEKYRNAYAKYLTEKKAHKGDPENCPEPIEPKRNFLLLPGNSSEASMYKDLNDNNGYGLIYESEADSIVNAMTSTFGGFSHLYRAGFHGEPASAGRVYFNEDGPREIDCVNLSLLVTSTIDQCFSLIPNDENGLFSRFIYYLLAPYSVFKSPYSGARNTELEIKIEEIAELYLQIGIDDKVQNGNIEFVYTDSQKEMYADFFEAFDTQFSAEYGAKLGGSINRFGLIFTRICMLLTYLRQYNNLEDLNQLTCDQKDFDITSSIVEKLLYHLQIIFHLYETQNYKQKQTAYIPSEIKQEVKSNRVPKEIIFKAIELRKKNYTYGQISKAIYGDESHKGNMKKVYDKYNGKAFLFPETETLANMSKAIRVKNTFKSTIVSFFKNIPSSNASKLTCTLWEALLNEEFKDEIQALRNVQNPKKLKALKEALPCFTPSGIFKDKRSKQNLVKHSKFICIDIDAKDNEHIDNFSSMIVQLSKVVNVAYCGLSVSGKGFYVLLPIDNPDYHAAYFNAISQAFREMGINVDMACSDVSRLRIISFNEEPYIAETARVITAVIEVNNTDRNSNLSMPVLRDLSIEAKKIAPLIEKIKQEEIDITSEYKDWFAIACSLANDLKEEGRQYFHIVSSFHHEYDKSESDKQFDACLRNTNIVSRYSLKTFFAICKNHGVL